MQHIGSVVFIYLKRNHMSQKSSGLIGTSIWENHQTLIVTLSL